jgi:hypothetical protein
MLGWRSRLTKEAVNKLDKQLKVLHDLSSMEWGSEQLELGRRRLEAQHAQLEAVRTQALDDLRRAEYARVLLEVETGAKQ